MTGRKGLPVFFAALFLGVVSLAAFPEDLIEELHPNPLRKGNRFTVSLYLDYDNPALVTSTAPVFPKALRLVRGPYIRGYFITSKDGTSKRKTKVTYTFAALKTGRYVLGSFELTTPGGSYKTVPQVVTVGVYKNKRLYVPYEISWVERGENFYTGQAVTLTAVVTNLPDIMIFDTVSVSLPSNGLFTKIDDPGPITDRTVGFQKLYALPVAGYLYTPSRPGRVKIPGIRVSGKGVTSVSRALYLTIKTPPESIRSTGAIGVFKRIYSVQPSALKKNGLLHVSVEVTGTGNLNYLEIPPLRVTGLTLIGEKDTQQYTGNLDGYSGKRGKVYTYTAPHVGDASIHVPPFPFLNPETDRVQVLRGRQITLHVSENASGLPAAGDPLSTFKPEQVPAVSIPLKSNRYRDAVSYLWLLPGPLVFLVIYFAGRKKILIISLVLVALSGGISGAALGGGVSLYEKGKYREAVNMYLDDLKGSPGSASLYYDLALGYHKLGMPGKAVYAAHIAAALSPFTKKYPALLHALETEAKLQYPVVVPGSVFPDTWLFILSLLVNGAGFIGVFYVTKKKNIYFIGMILLFGLSVVSSGGLLYAAWEQHQQYGVAARADTAVKKIPRDSSTAGFVLKEGETVKVVSSSGTYIFIENGIGVKGWVKKKNLLVFGGKSNPRKILTGAE